MLWPNEKWADYMTNVHHPKERTLMPTRKKTLGPGSKAQHFLHLLRIRARFPAQQPVAPVPRDLPPSSGH